MPRLARRRDWFFIRSWQTQQPFHLVYHLRWHVACHEPIISHARFSKALQILWLAQIVKTDDGYILGPRVAFENFCRLDTVHVRQDDSHNNQVGFFLNCYPNRVIAWRWVRLVRHAGHHELGTV